MLFRTFSSHLKRHAVRYRKNTEGAAAIEFALVASPFFFLLFAMLEVVIVMFANNVLETGTQDVGRLVMTGQSQKSAEPKTISGVTETQAQANSRVASEFKAALCGKVSALFNCNELKVDVRAFSSATTVSLPDPANCELSVAFDIGGPSDIVIVRVLYHWQTYATFLNFANCAGGKRQLISTAAFRNEPF